MRAVVCRRPGPPETLAVEELPEPVPGAGEVLVDVSHVGLNFADTLVVEGRYQVKPPPPFSPGVEFAGRVAGLGAGVVGLTVGDRVCAYMGFGAARQRVAVPASILVPVPPGVADAAAAGLPVAYGTALHALRQRARLVPGETLAVLGAAGGTGMAAVVIGRMLGARVIACASSPTRVAAAMQGGADAGLDYGSSDLRDELKRLTEGQGVDVVCDPVGGDLTEKAVRALAWKGRLLVIGFAAGAIPKLPLNLTLLKGCDVLGVYLRDFARHEPAAHRRNLEDLLTWTAEGRLVPHIHAVVPLDRVADAFGMIRGREAVGKVILRMAE